MFDLILGQGGMRGDIFETQDSVPSGLLENEVDESHETDLLPQEGRLHFQNGL